MIKKADYEGAPCACPLCRQAGVSEQPQIRDRYTGAWMHGYDLKRWYEAREKFWTEWDELKQKLGITAGRPR